MNHRHVNSIISYAELRYGFKSPAAHDAKHLLL
jgi:hypothetical protein